MLKLGQRLQEARKRKGMNLEEVAAATKIRPSFLSAIERDDYDSLPSPAYAQGFVMNYAAYLGFSRKETLALFRREFDERKSVTVLPKIFTHPQKYSTHFRVQRTAIAIVIIFIFLIGYLFLQYRSVFFNPPLNIIYPSEGSTVGQNIIVKGSTDPNAVVAVDGAIVTVDDNGNFSKAITLMPGLNKIQVLSKSRFGKISEVDRIVNVK